MMSNDEDKKLVELAKDGKLLSLGAAHGDLVDLVDVRILPVNRVVYGALKYALQSSKLELTMPPFEELKKEMEDEETMKDRLVVIDCPTCKGGIAITRAQLMKWNENSWFPICTGPKPGKPMNTCGRSIHFDDLPKKVLVKLLCMIATDPTPRPSTIASPNSKEATNSKKKKD